MSLAISELKRLKNKVGRAQDGYDKAFRLVFRKGTVVRFQKGNGTVLAKVIEITWCGDVLIKNLKTNKEYRVGGYWLLNGCIGNEVPA